MVLHPDMTVLPRHLKTDQDLPLNLILTKVSLHQQARTMDPMAHTIMETQAATEAHTVTAVDIAVVEAGAVADTVDAAVADHQASTAGPQQVVSI